ncbi:uncharacterized protein A4U43_UnF2670 [Asparagus officinalis]|uniref:Uncharacterized protein n=1 Tax=Asparagus officinalis TaxID=4686 RepID=A0A1R3L771_ASPOF|nr:uncharacterized protein A4U43_UnF2670 [Asparagus officinalis]
MDGIAPRMRAEHWRAYGSSNFKNYVSFGPIPADKATIMLLLDHLDLATGKFFFKDSQTRTPQAYTFDVNWDEAYEKLVMLNEAYEQALVARGVDILAIKAETEKKFAEEKRIRQNKGEPQIDEALSEGDQTREMDIELEEAKVEAEKEEGKGEEGGKEGDQTQAMGSEQEKKGRKRREGGDDTLKVFVSGLRAKSQRTTKKPKFLESPFQTELPKKGRKGKKGVVVVGDDDDKGEKDEGKPLAVSHLGRSTSVAELWKREKSEEEKKLLETLNMGIPSSQDFDVRLPGTINEGFYHNFTVEDIPDVLADENKWLQHFLTLKVDNRTIFEVEDHTICRYDMLHLLRGGRLKDEIIEALVASLRTWLKLLINAHVERKYAIVTSYFSAILEGREVMDIEVLHRESHMLRARLAAQIICEGREWKKLRLKLDSDDPEYLLYFGGSDAPMIEWKY